MLYTRYPSYADEHSLQKDLHRFHALCAKVNHRGKRKLPVILTGAKVQPSMKTTKKLENPRSATAQLGAPAWHQQKGNGRTRKNYRHSFTRMHNYLVF